MRKISSKYTNNTLTRLSSMMEKFFSKPEYVFLALVIPFGILSAALVPQISVTDENSHFQRAYEIADLNLICHKTVSEPREINEKNTKDPWKREYSSDYETTVNFSDDTSDKCRSASGYSPVLYGPQIVGIWAAKLFNPSAASIVLIARIASVLFYAAIVFMLIRHLKVGKWVLVVLALTPQMIHLAGSVSADPANNLIIFSSIVFMVNLFIQKGKISKKQLIILFVLAMLAALSKANNIVLFLPLLFLPREKFIVAKNPKWLHSIYKWIVLALLGTVFVLTYKIWTLSTNLDASQGFGIVEPLKFLKIIYHTFISNYGDLLIQGAFGQFSTFGYHIFTINIVAILLVLLVALFYVDKKEPLIAENTKKILSVVSITTLILYILCITYLFASMALPYMNESMKFANGVQGRYFTASLLLLLPGTLYFRNHIKVSFKKTSTIGKVCFVVIFLTLFHYTYMTIDYAVRGGFY